MNNCSIVGRIGKVSELRYTQDGKAVLNFSVATDNGKTADGEKRAATWFEITLWEKQAEGLAQYLTVGDRIGVSGPVRMHVRKTQDGKEFYNLTIDFPRVELLGSQGSLGNNQTTTDRAQAATQTNRSAGPPQRAQTGRPAGRPSPPPAARAAAPQQQAVSDEDILF